MHSASLHRLSYHEALSIRALAPILSCIALAAILLAGPAQDRPAHRAASGESVLPGGRLITPQGDQFVTAPGCFGIAVSESGRYVVTSDGGPRFAVTVLDNATGRTRQFIPKRDKETNADEDDWRSVFMGLAFSGETQIYASEGESGRIRLIDLNTGRKLKQFELNQGGFQDSYSGDLALDAARGLLFVLDQANFRLVAIQIRDGRIVSSIRTGRLPFALAYDARLQEAYVTNVGMFEYRAVPGTDPKQPVETGLPFPAFGFPSKEAARGVRRATKEGSVNVPALGDPNAPESNSVAIVQLSDAASPKIRRLVHTGLPFGKFSAGGSSPSGVVAHQGKLYITNANQDSITVILSLIHI